MILRNILLFLLCILYCNFYLYAMDRTKSINRILWEKYRQEQREYCIKWGIPIPEETYEEAMKRDLKHKVENELAMIRAMERQEDPKK